MSSAQSYRPRFVDIRIRPPQADVEEDAKRCDWADCTGAAECRAPKGPDRLRDYYWFCPRHAAEYNKAWNFFAQMSEDDVRAYQAAAATGHRPTWNMKTNTGAHTRARMGAGGDQNPFRGFTGGVFDPFDIFGPATQARAERPQSPQLGKLEARAFAALGFEGYAPVDEVRTRYTELVKRFHPDSNGGDRSSEHRLQDVIHAYKTLKRVGMA